MNPTARPSVEGAFGGLKRNRRKGKSKKEKRQTLHKTPVRRQRTVEEPLKVRAKLERLMREGGEPLHTLSRPPLERETQRL